MTPERVEILEKRKVFDQFFVIEEARLKVERYDGTMQAMTRLSFERGDSVAAVVHDPYAQTVIFTEQFRYPTFAKGQGWMLELPAGMVETGEDPAATMQRELEEEIGYSISTLEPISTFYVSPGGSSERILLYYVQATPEDRTSAGGGVATEAEDIRMVTVPLTEAFAMITDGRISDAKTIIGLQWLSMRLMA